MLVENPFLKELSPPVDSLPTGWRSSDLGSLHRALPEDSPLHAGVPTLDRVMFTLSNTELKHVVVFFGLNGSTTHINGIFGRINPLLSYDWNKDSLPSNIARLIRTSMIPTGFAQEPVPWQFATSPEGETILRDSAAFLLRRTVDLGMPLGRLFIERTEETSPPTRAYLTRMATLVALRNQSRSQAQLDDIFGGNLKSLSWNLRVLGEKGFIEYEAADPEVKGQQIYERVDLSTPPKSGVLIRNVFKFFQANERGNSYVIAQALGKTNTQRMGRVLRQLSEAGAIKPTKWSWTEKQSDAKITPLGEQIVDMVIVPLLAAYTGDAEAVQVLVDARQEIERDPTLAAEALDIYKRQAVRVPEIETQRNILSLVREQGALRRQQIIEAVGKNAHPQLIELVATGQLRTIRDGNASFYVLPESDEQPRRAEEVVIFDFNPPVDLFEIREYQVITKFPKMTSEVKDASDKKPRMLLRDAYRRDLDNVEFWQRLQADVQKIPADKYTARRFFLQYDSRYADWPQRWYSGVYSGYVRALWSLGVEKPWEFIRTYTPDGAPAELQGVIKDTQDLINAKLPLEYSPRIPARVFNKRLEALYTPDFWQQFAADVQSVPLRTKLQSFLWRFDPNMPNCMGQKHHHGKYYNFRHTFDRHTPEGAIAILTSFRAPQGSPIELQLAIREAQAAIRERLRVKGIPDDNFSDLEGLRKQYDEEQRKKQERQVRLQTLRSFYEKFSGFDESETKRLSATTAQHIKSLRNNIKGHDTDEASLATIGFNTIKRAGSEFISDLFPAELRAAYLVFAFEQFRCGREIPEILKYGEQWMFTNGEAKVVLATLEKYVTYYENQVKKKNPEAVLPILTLVEQLKKYISLLE